MEVNLLQKIQAAADYIRSRSSISPQIGLILGSGLGDIADEITDAVRIDYHDIPHFPVSTVVGHAGKLVIGMLMGKPVIALQGRFHFYEGYSLQEVTFPVRVFKALGITSMIVTNACGALNTSFYPGALMFITDHINFIGDNPLIGKNFNDLGPRFPDMSSAYDKGLIALGKKVAAELGVETVEGIYTAVSGPYYFSKAELRMVKGFGSDTIGMSTVPETIVAVHMGIKVLGISCITDMADPDNLVPLEHAHVVAVANQAKPKFIRLVNGIVQNIA
ncbi:MAG: purine-nucleoside phosphorylase [Bacteroidetes bacterium]|nr:purine-nucleoside phosphorylase [Bacteroidota bacterium]